MFGNVLHACVRALTCIGSLVKTGGVEKDQCARACNNSVGDEVCGIREHDSHDKGEYDSSVLMSTENEGRF